MDGRESVAFVFAFLHQALSKTPKKSPSKKKPKKFFVDSNCKPYAVHRVGYTLLV
jgi:hypothetical protein